MGRRLRLVRTRETASALSRKGLYFEDIPEVKRQVWVEQHVDRYIDNVSRITEVVLAWTAIKAGGFARGARKLWDEVRDA